MSWRRIVSVRWLAAAAVLAAGPMLLFPDRALGAGFSIFEQGTRAMGMAGAFTAQADDPSLLFHNAGGLAFVDERDVAVGVTWIRALEADFEGAAPFPGPSGSADQEKLSAFPPHAYWVQPINDTWKLGVGLETPFGLVTEWENPDQFSGRFVNTKAELTVIDVNPTLGWQVNPNFGIGFGAVARFSKVELNRNVPFNNPFTQRIIDIGRLHLESDLDNGLGWNVGVLHKWNPSFSWGFSYRSKVKVEYGGDARIGRILTGNGQLDALLGSQVPFDRDLPVETEIEFPDEASLGLAFAITPNLLVETDFNWTGWSSFDVVPITFTGTTTGGSGNSLPDAEIPEHWDDANNYRLGVRWTRSPTSQWRFGYVFDESPQPEEAVSPLLPDADRDGFTVGYGRTGRWSYDFALMYLLFDERTRERSFPGEGDFFGTYNTKAVLTAVTITF
jgi:long-chain fatty acid transport protein